MRDFQASFPLDGKTLWVTGGHGFLGRRLCARLKAKGAKVLAPSRTELDLMVPEAAEAFLEAHRPQGVIHLAARVGGIGANERHPGSFFYANMAMGMHLIEACRRAGTEKVLVMGTVCAYPKFTPVPFQEEDLWAGYPEETNAPYGIAKKALLVMLQSYRQEYGLRGIYLMPANLYGPGDHLDLASNHVIPALIRKFLEAKAQGRPQVELWGTGTSSREFLYVDDAAEAVALAMERYEDPAPVNVGTGQEIRIHELAQKIQALTAYEGQQVFLRDRPDGQPRRCLNTRRALEGFGWTAETDLDQGLRITVESMRSALAL